MYQHPSISSLTSYLLNFSSNSQSTSNGDVVLQKINDMRAMAMKYGRDLQICYEERVRGEVVLLTGTTGWLGSLVLAELLRSNVERVYAVNRRGTRLFDRQVQAFKERGIDVSLASSEKLILLEADLTKEDFGVDKTLFNEV